jgi:DNA-3-methyladenine glycosylase
MLNAMPKRRVPTNTLDHTNASPPAGRLTATMLRHAPILPREFFNRDPVTVGRELLGKLLIRREGRRLLAGRIVEDEAYLGVEDPAAHAYSGRTPRNSVLFGPPGHAYVYFIYGNHYCLNISCMPEGYAGCVLLRAMEPGFGLSAMARARGLELTATPRPAQLRLISSGPGRMSQALGITRLRDNDKDLTAPASDLSFADDGYRPERVAATPRVGITKAVEQPLRFVIAGSPFVSATRA